MASRDQEDEHSCFSDNTHRDAVTNAQGIQNVWLGTYHTDLLPPLSPQSRRRGLPADPDRAIGGIVETEQQLEQGRLAAPGRAHDGDEVSWGNGEVDAR